MLNLLQLKIIPCNFRYRIDYRVLVFIVSIHFFNALLRPSSFSDQNFAHSAIVDVAAPKDGGLVAVRKPLVDPSSIGLFDGLEALEDLSLMLDS